MSDKPLIVAMDLEGVLVPEVWIAFAEKTGIPELRLTTRDISDYNELMRHRLAILDEHKLKLPDIQEVIGTMAPLPGAVEYVATIRSLHQLIILSDTYYEFAEPLMRQLNWPTLFCNYLDVAADGTIKNYHLRQPDGKRHAVQAFHRLNFAVIAIGDSFNDLSMLGEADRGILFRPSETVVRQAPQFPVITEYKELLTLIKDFG